MSDHEDIIMGFDAVFDRLNDALLLAGATRESYLNAVEECEDLRSRLLNSGQGHAITATALRNALSIIGKITEVVEDKAYGDDADRAQAFLRIKAVLDGA